MRMWTNIDTIAIAVEKIQKACPNLQIASVMPAVDGVCFNTIGGATYKYFLSSGDIRRFAENAWRTHTAPALVEVEN